MFNPVEIHLLINHVPILGSIFGFLILTYGVFSKNRVVLRTAFTTLVIAGLMTLPAYFSGEDSEESVEQLAGISEADLEEHEEYAEIALWMTMTAAGLSLIALILSFLMDKIPGFLYYPLWLITLATVVIMTIVGHYGGRIRHSELRGEIASQSVKKVETVRENSAHETEDD